MNRRPYIPAMIPAPIPAAIPAQIPPRRLWRTLAVLAVVGALAACSSAPDKDTNVEPPVSEIYNKAMDALEDEQYAAASELFDEVERQHPYSVWAIKAQLMAGFAHYQAGRYDDAIIAVERFIQLHPGNRDVAYAYYLKALSYYERITDVSRDQKNTELALDAFEELAIRFPDTKYTEDALPKMDLILDHLAGKDMTIGRYYLQREHYLAAINRFRSVIEKYETTSHIPESLHRLVESPT